MKHIITLVIFLFSSTLMMAQIVDRTEQRAKDKANNRVDQKIDKGIDQGLDAIEGLFSKKKKKSNDKDTDSDEESTINDSQNNEESSDQSAARMSNLFGGKVDVEDSYSFDHNMFLNIQTWNKKGKEQDPMDMKMYFSEDEPNFGMEVFMDGASNFIVYDMESYQMITMINSDGQKIGMAMKLNPENFEEKVDEAREKEINKDYTFTKTGKTKVISGYNCDEYTMTSNESDPEWNYSYWVTDDIDANWIDYMSNMMSTNKKMANNYELPENYPEGAMIQIIGESNKNEEKTITTVKEFNKNESKSFSTGEYQFMSLPGQGGN